MSRLDEAMNALARESKQWQTPPGVEAALLAAVESRRHRERRRRLLMGAVTGAIAASVALLVWTMEPPAAPAPPTPRGQLASIAPLPAAPKPVAPRKPRRARRALQPEAPFIAIPFTQPLSPYEHAEMRRVDLPVAALIAAGLPMNMADPAGLARADLLIGQDGRARAVRLIALSTSN